MTLITRKLREFLAPASPAVRPWDMPVFAPDGLERLRDHAGYNTMKPFPHLQLDGLFNPDLLRAILAEWPAPDRGKLEAHNDGTFVRQKHNTTWETPFGPHTRRFFEEMAHPRVLMALEHVTQIWGLLPDPYLFGGGLHMTGVGGKLAVHADFNKHPRSKLDRRLNLLVYLNEGWTEENAGWLELWDRSMTSCVARVLPVFNRTAMFTTTSFSFHGQPEPIQGPPSLVRRSLALYYYTNGRPGTETTGEEHSTLWRERPVEGF